MGGPQRTSRRLTPPKPGNLHSLRLLNRPASIQEFPQSGNGLLRILHLEDSPRDAEIIRNHLEANHLAFELTLVDRQSAFENALALEHFDIILCDHNLHDYDGISAIAAALTACPHTPVIMVSGSLSPDEAVACLKKGAIDYLLKDKLERLGPAVRRAVDDQEKRLKLRHAEAALHKQSAELAEFVELAAVGIHWLDSHGFIQLVNQAEINLTGYSREELVGQHFSRFYTEDPTQNSPSSPIPFPLLEEHSHTLYCKDGSRKSVMILRRDFLDDQQNHHSHCFVRDVTQQRQAESLIRQSERHFRELFETATDLIQTATADGRLLYVNRAWKNALGYSDDDIPNLTLAMVVHPQDYQRYEAHRARLFTQDFAEQINLTLVKKNGELLLVEGSSTSQPTNEKPLASREIFRDVTERTRAQQLAQRTQRLESIGQLAGGVAHDINNALSPILIATDLLRLKAAPSGKLLETIEASTKRCAAMVRQLLTFARGSNGELVTVRPLHLLKELAGIIAASFPKNITVHHRYSPELATIKGDPTQLHQVLLNLCVNARDAMPNGGDLTIESSIDDLDSTDLRHFEQAQPGRYFVCKVTDTGEGIAPHHLDRIFDPFFTTKNLNQGTGLGLSMVMGIVKAHGGHLHVHSTLGQGSVFSIYLPSIADTPQATEIRPPITAFHGNDELVLVVDDEPSVRQITQALLLSLNFRVIVAESGQDALTAIATHQKHLRVILTDLNMPNMDWLALAREARMLIPDASIIVASGRMENTQIREFKALGINTFLDKPFTRAHLITALTPILKTKAQG